MRASGSSGDPEGKAGKETPGGAGRRAHGWLGRVTSPPVLFPLVAVLALVAVWITTFDLIRVHRSDARQAAVASTHDYLDTYEAQVVRVLREIDRTLRSVQYAYHMRGDAGQALKDLGTRDLLPPPLLFTVSVAGPDGRVRASTSSSTARSVADDEAFRLAARADTLVVGRPVAMPGEGRRMRFARRLTSPAGAYAGVVLVEVDPSFFVSGYDSTALGRDGTLGVAGVDGVFRALRAGDRVLPDERVHAIADIPVSDTAHGGVTLTTNPWDGVRRYTASRKLYAFPLAIVVGLAENEQLASADRQARMFLWRATGGSVALLLILGLLGRTTWKLDRLRRRESEARIAHARRVEHLAYHDGLTGLPNRSLLGRLVERHVSEARRYGRKMAVLFLDLDRFKEVNDSLGHEAGDQLLREVAERLERTLRDSDTVARMGGDEFVVLLPELEDARYAAVVARKILAALREPVDILGQEFTVTASIGVSVYPGDGEDDQALIKNADIAMYQAKDAGKNDVRFYSDHMTSHTRERLALEASLRKALERREFELHYQVRRDVRTGHVTGMEALLRWRHPELGMVEPVKFIPLAEETGLIVPIGRWVLTTACRQSVAWVDEGLPRLAMAVNIGARQFFDEGLMETVRDTLEATGMEPGLLELEVCESVLTRDAERTVSILKALKELGVGITIDNFGTGYSTLAVLRQFPLDTVKVDRTFIRDAGSDRVEREVTDAIVAMGRSLGTSLVAQGVETQDQADYLREHACDEVQGFFFNRPVPADAIARLLRQEMPGASSAGARPLRGSG
jgi:diguanylate cyclase (GGDEF)-like protein